MMRFYLFIIYLAVALICRVAESTAQLLPSIGISNLPSDNDTLCAAAVYTGGFGTSGYFEGDTVPDFTLYDRNGTPYTLSALLQSGTPAMLVAGSYTCPVFRGKINALNNMASVYAGQLNIFVVYTVEAHPVNDPSPYSGTVWVPSANYTDSVLYSQPVTYGERKALIDSMLLHYTINAPVLVDGPCNEWWNHYGPAPNNAYLINSDGVVFEKHAWFHKAPENMYCAIDSLLGINSGLCTSFGNNGTFSFSLDADSVAYGAPGQSLEIHATITNNSTSENVVMDIIKRTINTPIGWQSALCADVCYAPLVDSIRITIPPSGTQPFTFYFYTDLFPNQGYVNVLFRNVYLPNNKIRQGFYGYTNITGIESPPARSFGIYPNPVRNQLHFTNETGGQVNFRILDVSGKVIQAGSSSGTIMIDLLESGIYYLLLRQNDHWTVSGFVK